MLLSSLYLGLNALLYIIVGIWCTLSPANTSRSVGLELVGNQGTAEFVAVYGGLEFALGVFFAVSTVNSSFREAGLVFGSILYGGLVVFRIFSMATNGAAIGSGWNFFILEAGMLAAGLYCWLFTEH